MSIKSYIDANAYTKSKHILYSITSEYRVDEVTHNDDDWSILHSTLLKYIKLYKM